METQQTSQKRLVGLLAPACKLFDTVNITQSRLKGFMDSELWLLLPLFVLPAVLLVTAYVAGKNRHSRPRLVLFFYGSLLLGLGILCSIFFYQDFSEDKVRIFLLKSSIAHDKFCSPITFILSSAFNFLLSLALLGGGLFGVLKAINDSNFKFKKQ